MNTPNEIRIDNPQFLKKQPLAYNCFITLGKNFLSYALLDEANSSVFAIRHFDFKHQVIGKNDFELMFSDKFIQKASQFHLAINTQKRTLAPSHVVDVNHLEMYIQHQFELDKEETLYHMAVNHEFSSIFTLKMDTVNFLKNRLPKVDFYDASATMLKTYPKHFSANRNIHCFISVATESSTITVYQSQKLIFHKSFPNATEYDLLYHTLNVVKQFKLPTEETHVQLHGENANLTTRTHELFEGRFGELGYINRLHEIAFPEDMYSHPSHYFFNLFSLVSCVS